MKYRKKPVVVEAVQWKEDRTFDEVPWWLSSAMKNKKIIESNYYLHIHTLEGIMVAYPSDYIIKGIKGELYPCNPDIFTATYEPVDPFDTL